MTSGPPVVTGGGEEQLRFPLEEGLLLGLVADVQHCDVGADDAPLAREPLGVRPHEALAGDAEVEAVAVDLDHVGQRRGEPPHVVRVRHATRVGRRLAP